MPGNVLHAVVKWSFRISGRLGFFCGSSHQSSYAYISASVTFHSSFFLFFWPLRISHTSYACFALSRWWVSVKNELVDALVAQARLATVLLSPCRAFPAVAVRGRADRGRDRALWRPRRRASGLPARRFVPHDLRACPVRMDEPVRLCLHGGKLVRRAGVADQAVGNARRGERTDRRGVHLHHARDGLALGQADVGHVVDL